MQSQCGIMHTHTHTLTHTHHTHHALTFSPWTSSPALWHMPMFSSRLTFWGKLSPCLTSPGNDQRESVVELKVTGFVCKYSGPSVMWPPLLPGWSSHTRGVVSCQGDIYTKMWDLVPEFGSLITGGTAQQRSHITGGTTVPGGGGGSPLSLLPVSLACNPVVMTTMKHA